MLATCIHLLRGTLYIFQGEELGMTNPGYSDISECRDVESINYYHILLEDGKIGAAGEFGGYYFVIANEV